MPRIGDVLAYVFQSSLFCFNAELQSETCDSVPTSLISPYGYNDNREPPVTYELHSNCIPSNLISAIYKCRLMLFCGSISLATD